MTDLQQTIGQCNACRGEVYHDGLNWRHRANDLGLRQCPPERPSPREYIEQADQMLFDAGVAVLHTKTKKDREYVDRLITDARVLLEQARARLT